MKHRRCRFWELESNWTFDGLFLVTICNVMNWKDQFRHVLIHFVFGLIFGGSASFFLGLGIEFRDGENNRIEGFSVFPDFFFRILGAVSGGVFRFHMIGLFYERWADSIMNSLLGG